MQWSSHSGGQNNETRVQFLAKENAFVHVHPLGCHDISWKPARRRNCWTTKFHCIFILSNNWASLHSSHNLTAVSNICEVVLISLFWAPNGLNKLSQICFKFPSKLIGKSTIEFLTDQSWSVYTCQVSSLRRYCHACGSKTWISCLLTPVLRYVTPGGKVWAITALTDTFWKIY